MMKITVVTATRAEYGILRPLIIKFKEDKEIDLDLVVTGTHLLEKYGNTYEEIIKDGISITQMIPILEEDNTPYGINLTMSNAMREFAKYFKEQKPDCVIILGDRTEMLAISCAAMNEQIPIAHLHGGELTEGAVDDCVRHAITKLSYLHFPATEVYRKRIIQMGESPERVFNVGALGVENTLKVPLMSRAQICTELGIPQNQKYVVVTFHPVTTQYGQEREQVNELLQAMRERSEYFYLITKANADAGGELVNELLEKFCSEEGGAHLVSSLGVVRYLSAVKHAEFVLGNSSSGIIEAPALGTPTVNIGDRQKGRLMADTVVSCDTVCENIIKAMEVARNMEHKLSYDYGDGNTSGRIVTHIKEFLNNNIGELAKSFWNIQ